MIKLFESTEISFNNNGLGCLNDAITCIVTEKLNGEYELELTYPVDGIHYNDISLDRIIYTKANSYTEQPFRIYSISKPINKIITVNAQHISYDLSNITVKGALENYAYTVQEIFEYIRRMTLIPCQYSYSSDVTRTGNMCLSKPRSVRSILGTDEGILSIFGGEYEFDMYNVTLHERRGSDRGVCIEYGKNLTDLKQEENNAEMYTAVYPYYFVEDDGLQTLDDNLVRIIDNPVREKILTLDLTSDFEEMPTQEVLIEQTRKHIEKDKLNEPKVSLTVSFVKNPEIADSLQDVRLGDTVTVKFIKLGVNSKSRCICTKYNCITDKYDSIELGEPTETLSDTVSKVVKDQSNTETDLTNTNVKLDNEIDRATEEEKEIHSEIVKTDESIRLDVAAVKSGLESQITLTADSINSNVSNVKAGLESQINQTADTINSRVTNVQSGLESQITQTANGLSARISDNSGNISTLLLTASSLSSQISDVNSNLSSRISQNASDISMKVSADDVCNSISVSTDDISISGNRFIVNSDNFSLDRYGNLTAKNANLSGEINATSGTIGGLKITSTGLEGINGSGKETKIWYNSVQSGAGDFSFIRTNTILTKSGRIEIGNDESTHIDMIGKVSIMFPNASTAAPNTRIQDNSGYLAIASGSSRRFKHDISPVYNADLDPHKLYDIGICQYKYNLNYLDSDDQRYNQDVIGFIAEDIYEKYPVAADIGAFGQVNDWNLRFIVPPMLQLIQEQHKEIEILKSSLVMLNGKVAILEKRMEE